jgi:hypothetical protein
MARVVVVCMVAAAALCIGAASVGASVGQVSKQVVQTQAAKIVAHESGQPRPIVTCPHGLNAKVGASVKCSLVAKGSTLVYPVKVTVRSIHGNTADFFVQVGQAPGAASKTEFCKDNAILDKSTDVAQTPADLIPIFEANESTILDFQATAPPQIVAEAGKLVEAARNAVKTGNASAFASQSIQKAGATIDAFCAQNPDGTPISG